MTDSGWRLIVEPEPRRGSWNMAVDDLLLREAEAVETAAPVLRLYSWAPACLSIGYHQRLRETWDEACCAGRGFDLVRRPTGGKAVLHDDEVTYAVVARQDRAPFAGLGLAETYALIAEAIAGALRHLGLAPVLSRRQAALAPKGGAPCFLVPSENEVTVEGRKVVGSAQRRGRGAFLQHGAIPLRLDYEALALASGQPVGHAEAYRRAFAGLADLRPGLGFAEVAVAMTAGFREAFPGPWEARGLSREETERARTLQETLYGTDAWNRHAPEAAASETVGMGLGGATC